MFYFLFYFDGMQSPAIARKQQTARSAHPARFTSARDARNRKVRGLWVRGDRFYAQVRVAGEKSARKIPLKATTLGAAKEELVKARVSAREGALPRGGVKPRFDASVADYLDFHEKNQTGRKPATIQRERTSLQQWKKALGHVRIDKITKPMVVTFVKDRIRAGVSPRTANVDVIVLRAVLTAALDDGLISALPTAGVRPLKTVPKKRPMLMPAHFDALCQAARTCEKNGEQLVDYIRFLALSGSRCNEALRIKWSDVGFSARVVCIGADGNSKNSRARYVNFNPELEGHLREMWNRRAPDTDWLFPSPQRGENDRPAKSLRESFKIARKAAGLEWVGFHDLRHYFASTAVMAGIDFKTIAEWLGHQDGGVLLCKVYSHLLAGHKSDMAARLNFAPRIVALCDAKSPTPLIPGSLGAA